MSKDDIPVEWQCLSVAAVKRFTGEGKRLVITVDNGISALEPIRLADRLCLDAFVAK